jgi:hypothetical protein
LRYITCIEFWGELDADASTTSEASADDSVDSGILALDRADLDNLIQAIFKRQPHGCGLNAHLWFCVQTI